MLLTVMMVYAHTKRTPWPVLLAGRSMRHCDRHESDSRVNIRVY